jgi:UDP-N-acetylglucosamine:LPS N-acetylglucosamine transferase
LTILQKKESLLRKNLENQQGLHTLITGQTNVQNSYREGANPVVLDHQPTREMLRLIQGHKVIISRSGYSTIMDMHFLNRAIIIVPTPGQTDALKTTNSCPNSPLNFRSVLRNILRNPSGKPEISE